MPSLFIGDSARSSMGGGLMPPISAGLLMFRRAGELQVLLGHPGGPAWAKRDAGAWTLPKGMVEPGEDLLTAAGREFTEETGLVAAGPFYALGSVRQKSGKVVHAWAFAGDADAATCRSNLATMQWPPRSGQWKEFPELDRFAFFSIEQANNKLNPAQAGFLDRLVEQLR